MAKTNKTAQHKKAVLEALEKTLGIVTQACKIAGVSRTQFYHWINTDGEFADAVKSIDDVVLDFVESKLHKQIDSGNPTSTIFYLKTKGRKRGYIETKDITNNGGSFNNPFEGLTLEQLEALAKLKEDDSTED
jgi:hypothetical protein